MSSILDELVASYISSSGIKDNKEFKDAIYNKHDVSQILKVVNSKFLSILSKKNGRDFCCAVFQYDYLHPISIIRNLVKEHKVNMHAIDYCGNNRLHNAVRFKASFPVIKYIIDEYTIHPEQKNFRNKNCLQLALEFNQDITIIKYFVEICKLDPRETDDYGNNALHLAVMFSCPLHIIKYFINERKMDPEFTNFYGCTCAHLTMHSCADFKIAKYFKEYGLDFSKKNNDGVLPLRLLVSRCDGFDYSPWIIFFAKELKIKPSDKDELNSSYLHTYVTYNNNINVCKLFVNEFKMNPKEKDINGQNCLHLAVCSKNSLQIIKYFVEDCQIDPSEKDIYESDAISDASGEILEYFQKRSRS